MNLHRRDFLKLSSFAGLSAFLPTQAGFAFPKDTILEEAIRTRIYDKLKNPVIIQAIELVRTQGELFVRVISKDGVTGITQCNDRMNNLGSLLNGLVVPFFTGRDARDIVFLTEEVYQVNSHYKYAGMPFWNCVAHVEIAIWDLLGKMAAKPVHHFWERKSVRRCRCICPASPAKPLPNRKPNNWAKSWPKPEPKPSKPKWEAGCGTRPKMTGVRGC